MAGGTTVLLAGAISDACERGLAEVDSLRGYEAYKRNFTSEQHELIRLRAAAGWLGRLAMMADREASKAKTLVGPLVRRIAWRPET